MLRTDFMRAVSLTRLKLRHPGDLAQNSTSVPRATWRRAASGPTVLLLLLGVVFRLPGERGRGGGRDRRDGPAGNSDGDPALRRMGADLAAVPVLWLELLVVGGGTAVGLASYPFGRRY
jgi:hypothetical protein